MKIITLLTTLVLTASISFSQELTVKYDMTMESSNPEAQAQIGMMDGSTLAMYVKKNQSRVEANIGNGLMVTTTITDLEKKKGLTLMSGMMGKLASSFSTDSIKGGEDPDFKIELVDETKKILGHTCKKAVMYGENDLEFVYWYTEDFKLNTDILGPSVKKGLPGLPLEFSIEQPQMTMKYIATDLEEKVKNPKEKFDLSVPEGYTEKSAEDMKKMLGQ